MKRYVLTLYLFLPFAGAAQSVVGDEKQQDLLGQGHLSIGISVGGGYRGTYPNINYITPRIQYFLKDGWSIAAEGNYLKSESAFTYVGAGLSSRYYFLRRKRLALFAHLGASYGKSDYNSSLSKPAFDPNNRQSRINNNWQLNAGLGAHYRLGKRWTVEAVAGRSWLQNLNPPLYSFIPADYNRWQVSVGISYRLK